MPQHEPTLAVAEMARVLSVSPDSIYRWARFRSAAAPVADPIAQIERLAELRDKGILSENEFQAQKTQLLSNL
ncbi:SHOCT domain-containing protein [Microbacterium sp. AG238]|uniref:SHOCT domain-containing protein n=1 Tax=Microbacterium sp. AG238 TaxID=2183994 RepID=UPI00217E1CF4|nr:SHOCT domain-containing protein [Microbacterium sp. AG238]